MQEWIGEAERVREESDCSNSAKQSLRTIVLKHISNFYEYVTDWVFEVYQPQVNHTTPSR